MPPIVYEVVNIVLLLGILLMQLAVLPGAKKRSEAQSEATRELRELINTINGSVEAQARIAQSALEYARQFDPKKIRELAQQELAAQHRAEIDRYEEQLRELSRTAPADEPRLGLLAAPQPPESEIDKMFEEYVEPMSRSLVLSLMFTPEESREIIVDQIPEPYRGKINQKLVSFDRAKQKLITNFSVNKKTSPVNLQFTERLNSGGED
jgi:hypothetical protein